VLITFQHLGQIKATFSGERLIKSIAKQPHSDITACGAIAVHENRVQLKSCASALASSDVDNPLQSLAHFANALGQFAIALCILSTHKNIARRRKSPAKKAAFHRD